LCNVSDSVFACGRQDGRQGFADLAENCRVVFVAAAFATFRDYVFHRRDIVTTPIKVTPRQARRLERNLSGSTPPRKQKDHTGEIMTALQVAAGRALDMAGVAGKARQSVLLSPEFNRHCLKAARALAGKQ
jgi:hypothetical protein